MARFDAKIDVRLDLELSKEIEKMAKEFKCKKSDIGRAAYYLLASEHYTDKELGFNAEDLPYRLAVFVKEQVARRKKRKAA